MDKFVGIREVARRSREDMVPGFEDLAVIWNGHSVDSRIVGRGNYLRPYNPNDTDIVVYITHHATMKEIRLALLAKRERIAMLRGY